MKQFPQEYSVLFGSFAEILNNCWKQQLKKQRSSPPTRYSILFLIGELMNTTKCFSIHPHKKSFLCVKMSWMNSVSKANDQHNYPVSTNHKHIIHITLFDQIAFFQNISFVSFLPRIGRFLTLSFSQQSHWKES